ncbi:hypothetical protein EV122DRAFT_283396 [Schizophyllum commune]
MSDGRAKKKRRHAISARTRGTIFDSESLTSVDRLTTRTSRQEECDRIDHERQEMVIRRAGELRQQLEDASLEAGVYSRTEEEVAADDIWAPLQESEQPDSADADDSDWEDERVEMVVICGDTRRRRRRATLDKEERARRCQEAWQADMIHLTHAYLQYKHTLVPDDDNSIPGVAWSITTLGVRELDWARPFVQREGQSANTVLLHHGLLGASPVSPSIAFTTELLELYHQLRRHQPSFSIQAMVKTLCSIHNLSYRHTYRQQFSDCFDAYLAILRAVQLQTDAALGRGFDWLVKSQCAAIVGEIAALRGTLSMSADVD